jgi:hypothetical protein
MRLPTRPLLLAALALSFSACDTYGDGYDDGYYDGLDDAPTNGATVVDFTLDATDYSVSTDQRTATYESDDIDSGTVRAAVEDALATAGDGALVALYIDTELVTDVSGTSRPYSALPLSRGFEELVVGDTDGDGQFDDPVNVVGYTASYEYSFDNGDLYFDVVSSTRASEFGADPTVLFDFITPQQQTGGVRQGPSTLSFRLVTIEADEFTKRPVDLTDYAAVAAAYNLPD